MAADSTLGVNKTSIPAAALLTVLQGVAFATKAPDDYVRPLARRLEFSKSTTYSDWLAAIITDPENDTQGTRSLAQVTLAVGLLRELARGGQPIDTIRLDTVWALVHSAILGAQGTALHFIVSRSAQGFLSVALCSLITNGRIDELWRLHAWLPDGQRGVSEDVCIHAHQPFGQSWILLGAGTDCAFNVDSPDDASLATHAAYECCYVPSDPTGDGKSSQQAASGYQTHQVMSAIRNTGRLLRVEPGRREPHSRDMTYSVPGGAYHRSIVSGTRLHATLFVFDAQRGYDDDAAVLGPKDGVEYVQPRDPDGISATTLAHIVDDARKWEQANSLLVDTEGSEEHATVMGYYRFFRGLELLQAGRKGEAQRMLNNPASGTMPAQAFALDSSSPHHSDYIKRLVQVGSELD